MTHLSREDLIRLRELDALPDRDRVILLLTSDHGMTNTSAEQTVQLGSLVDTTNIRTGYSGPVTGLHVSGPPGDVHRGEEGDLE